MGFPVTVNGNTYTLANFATYAYIDGIPNIAADIAAVGQSVQDAAAVIAGSAPGETILASAAAVNIGGTNTTRVAITGSTTVTSFGAVPNRIRLVRFTGALTLQHNAASLILPGGATFVTAAGDTAIAVSDASGNWRVFGYQRADGAGSPALLTKIDIVTSTQNYTPPSWAKFLDFVTVAGGGGGGSGRRGAAGSGRGGGGGGGAGGLGYAPNSFAVSELAFPLSIEVGLGGAPGAAVTTDNANGGPGGNGGNSRVLSGGGVVIVSGGGQGGSGGTTGAASGGFAGTLNTLDFGNGNGGAGAAGAGSGAQNGLQASAGGGGGGGLSAGDVPGNGGNAGFGCLIGRTTTFGPGGAAPGGNGTDGVAKPWPRGFGGSGGGGAAGNAAGTVAGGTGGAGAACGGAGGGGGASTNGAASGVGGAGGRGEIWIIARG